MKKEKMKKAKKMILAFMACLMAVMGTRPAIPADAALHIHRWGLHSISTPSCTQGGCAKYVCSKCGKYKSLSLSKMGHSYATNKKAATCTAAGYRRKYCVRCGKTASKTTYSKLGHDYCARKATAAEKKAYRWGTALVCKRCGHKTGSYADY